MRVRLKESVGAPPGWEQWYEFEIVSMSADGLVLILPELPDGDMEYSDARLVSQGFCENVLAAHYETVEDNSDDREDKRPVEGP